jgi:hypothetical protein
MIEPGVLIGGEVLGERLDGVAVVARVAAVRQETAVLGVGEE